MELDYTKLLEHVSKVLKEHCPTLTAQHEVDIHIEKAQSTRIEFPSARILVEVYEAGVLIFSRCYKYTYTPDMDCFGRG